MAPPTPGVADCADRPRPYIAVPKGSWERSGGPRTLVSDSFGAGPGLAHGVMAPPGTSLCPGKWWRSQSTYSAVPLSSNNLHRRLQALIALR